MFISGQTTLKLWDAELYSMKRDSGGVANEEGADAQCILVATDCASDVSLHVVAKRQHGRGTALGGEKMYLAVPPTGLQFPFFR